ncbi:MAG: tetratricopeptide repeat protein, partial [Burkholderiales bacterium]
AAIRAQNWNAAIASFGKVAAREPRDADAQNFLGFAYRKSGNLDLAFKHYNDALKLDPKHRGAHEYIGEAYLMQGNLTKAREHLGQLDKLCFFGCAEYTDLKKAIAEFETKTKK